MDNALMIGLSRQLSLRRQMDVTANNIANANTPGFKLETLLTENRAMHTATSQDGPAQIQYVDVRGLARDFQQGEMEYTARLLDVAIDGEGFFSVEAEGGDIRYTRDGRFRLDQDGRMTAMDGSPVLGEGGAPILLDPGAGEVRIIDSGAVMQGENQAGRLAVWRFEDLGALSKTGDGRYVAPPGVEPDPVANAVVRQGFVERSNVSPIIELTRMIETMRAYESVSRFIKQTEDLNRTAIERLGKV